MRFTCCSSVGSEGTWMGMACRGSQAAVKCNRRSSEGLTRKALEEHDKRVTPAPPEPTARTRSQSRDDRASMGSRGGRILSRAESKGSLTQPRVGESTSRSQLERKPTRSSLYTPTSTMRSGRLNVFRVVAAATAWKRLSERRPAILAALKPKVATENTYKLGPDEGKAFKPDKVKAIIETVLNSFLKSFRYTPEGSRRMCLAISKDVKSRVKMLDFQRYKLVCNVMIMQNKGQSSQISSRCLGNADLDGFASASITTPQIIALVTVHAAYFD
ncbi:Tctex1 domain-containing protein 1 [Elysia marginata]|uniref:Tctex1 domain-containing protein 1 n=1 Tax=Elysia marginata TaxID=1093978 RepID=A0AAV4HCQ7_9GAST|nr:Tctex1 domain-containing protein 1 [Elysia marginata]